MTDWIEWNGGAQPVPDDTYVEVRFRDGDYADAETAMEWAWWHDGRECDIVAYRVLEDAQ